jgi:hypothetical protein
VLKADPGEQTIAVVVVGATVVVVVGIVTQALILVEPVALFVQVPLGQDIPTEEPAGQ